MINIKYKGRLGNNIFQYCLGRIIAEKLNYKLVGKLDNFTNCIELDGQNFSYPIQTLLMHNIDINKILNNKESRKIILKGYFHNITYYFNSKNKIKKWLEIDNSYRIPTAEDLVLHVRGGDIYNKNPNCNHPPVPFYYYKNIIESESFNKLYIVTEFTSDIMVKKLSEKYKSEIISQSPIEDYFFMLNSKKLVLSLSTLSWWSGWMSNAEKIYFPMYGFWHPNSIRTDVNLVVNEDRYIYKDLGVMDNWNASVEQIKNLYEE